MDAILTLMRCLRADTRGATAIEYGLIVALIAVASIGGMQTLGGGVTGAWGRLLDTVNTYMN